MSKPLISIIVPCYNVEAYLSKCLDSIINQTYDNLEVICVEDCSTDTTINYINDYLEKDKRIRLIQNKENSGLAYSRNTGLKESNGEYICFIDSDDYISSNYIEELYNAIENNDLSIADIICVRDDKETIVKCYGDTKLDIVNNGYAASACNKMFKKSVIQKYQFEVGKLNEDIAVVIPIMINSNNVGYAKDVYYYYVQRGNSIQNATFSDRRFDIFDGVALALERIKDNSDYNEIKNILVFNQLISTLIYVVPYISDKNKRLEVITTFGSLLSKYDITNNPYLEAFINNNRLHNKLFYKRFFKAFNNNDFKKCNNLFGLLRFKKTWRDK